MSSHDTQLVVWAIVAALALITEMVTLALIALYVCIGAIAAGVAVLVGFGLATQVGAFAVVGVLLLVLTRPIFMRRLQKPQTVSNVHALVGRTGIVTVPIDNHRSTGQIRVGTEFWTARTVDDDAPTVPVDAQVVVREVAGVTARVDLRELPPTGAGAGEAAAGPRPG